MGFILANTQGRLHPADQPSISPLDRGFLYGDAIYEVWRTYDRVVFAFPEHWARLTRSAEALGMALPFAPDELIGQILRTVASYRRRSGDARGEVYIRLQITRGGGAIGLDPALADSAHWVLLVQSLKKAPRGLWTKGVRLSIARQLHRNHPLTLNPAWKTGNYLNNLLCLREARARGADEVLIQNLDGELTECAVCNFAVVREGCLVTPPMAAGILGGITRGLLLDKVARLAGLTAVEATLRADDLRDCAEAMILSTTRDVAPVGSVDDFRFTVTRGMVSGRLKKAFTEYSAEEASAHPELRC